VLHTEGAAGGIIAPRASVLPYCPGAAGHPQCRQLDTAALQDYLRTSVFHKDHFLRIEVGSQDFVDTVGSRVQDDDSAVGRVADPEHLVLINR